MTDEYWAGENLRLGKLLVLGNSNYINSVKGHLKGTEDLNYLGYVDALQEIQMYAENSRRQLESGLITTEQYLAYKNNLEQIVGTSLDDFSSNMDVIFQAANVTETKGKQLAIKGMGDAFTEYTPTTDYDIDEDYISLEAAEAAAQKEAMSNIVLPDSTSILPDSTIISTDSLHIPANTEVVIDSLDQISDPEDIFSQVPSKEDKTWADWWSDWKSFGVAVTIGGVKVSAAILNTISDITSREEMVTYLETFDREGAEQLPKDLYKEWLELNQGKQ